MGVVASSTSLLIWLTGDIEMSSNDCAQELPNLKEGLSCCWSILTNSCDPGACTVTGQNCKMMPPLHSLPPLPRSFAWLRAAPRAVLRFIPTSGNVLSISSIFQWKQEIMLKAFSGVSFRTVCGCYMWPAWRSCKACLRRALEGRQWLWYTVNDSGRSPAAKAPVAPWNLLLGPPLLPNASSLPMMNLLGEDKSGN